MTLSATWDRPSCRSQVGASYGSCSAPLLAPFAVLSPCAALRPPEPRASVVGFLSSSAGPKNLHTLRLLGGNVGHPLRANPGPRRAGLVPEEVVTSIHRG